MCTSEHAATNAKGIGSIGDETLGPPNPTTHPMTSSLGYKRTAKHTETNVIGDGLLLTNFRNAK